MNGRLTSPPRSEWAPAARGRDEPKARCCAKCRRGVPGFGDLPCGFPDGCPNPRCLHAAHPEPKTETKENEL